MIFERSGIKLVGEVRWYRDGHEENLRDEEKITEIIEFSCPYSYRVSYIRCSTARHERGCAACQRREQSKATLRRMAEVKARETVQSLFPVPFREK
jgi:hypothetical protein